MEAEDCIFGHCNLYPVAEPLLNL